MNAYGSGGIAALHSLAALPQQEESLVCTGWEARLLAEPGWMLWRRDRLFASLRIEPQFLDSLACSPVTTLELSHRA
jgi:hypothetical protein